MIRTALISALGAALVVVACSSAEEAREAGPPAPTEQRLPTIDHIAPPRDSVGAAPTRFAWTAAEGADEYAIGIWNDVDRLMWRHDHVRGTSVMLPEDVEFEFGTYFWAVIALKNDRPIAESGRSAFVVK